MNCRSCRNVIDLRSDLLAGENIPTPRFSAGLSVSRRTQHDVIRLANRCLRPSDLWILNEANDADSIDRANADEKQRKQKQRHVLSCIHTTGKPKSGKTGKKFGLWTWTDLCRKRKPWGKSQVWRRNCAKREQTRWRIKLPRRHPSILPNNRNKSDRPSGWFDPQCRTIGIPLCRWPERPRTAKLTIADPLQKLFQISIIWYF